MTSSSEYVSTCITLGILTEEDIRKYPLRNTNLGIVLKVYANAAHKPYTLSPDVYVELERYTLYLTDDGLDWLLEEFQKHSLRFLRRTYKFVFINATAKDVTDRNYIGYRNFCGLVGDRPQAGTKQAAVLVRTVGPHVREYPFDTLKEARKELMNLSRFYPLEQFTLYRIRKNTKKGKVLYYRAKVPLLVEKGQRGAHLRGGNT